MMKIIKGAGALLSAMLLGVSGGMMISAILIGTALALPGFLLIKYAAIPLGNWSGAWIADKLKAEWDFSSFYKIKEAGGE